MTLEGLILFDIPPTAAALFFMAVSLFTFTRFMPVLVSCFSSPFKVSASYLAVLRATSSSISFKVFFGDKFFNN